MKRLRYIKETDADVLIEINAILLIRPTYVHKRVTAMINKKRKVLDLPRYNSIEDLQSDGDEWPST